MKFVQITDRPFKAKSDEYSQAKLYYFWSKTKKYCDKEMVQISSVMQNQILKLALMGVYKKF
jgi:hypothetical protein